MCVRAPRAMITYLHLVLSDFCHPQNQDRATRSETCAGSFSSVSTLSVLQALERGDCDGGLMPCAAKGLRRWVVEHRPWVPQEGQFRTLPESSLAI